MRGFFFLLLLTNLSLLAWQYYEQHNQSETVNVYHGIPIVNNGLVLINELPKEKRPPLRDGEEEETTPSGQDTASSMGEDSGNVGTGIDKEGAADGMASSTGSRCYRIADIDTMSEREELTSKLESRKAEIIEQGKAQGTRNSYWVVLPAYKNRKKANEAAELLASKRVKDFFIVRSGEHENAISLGVFTTKERAQRRYDEIANLNARLRKPEIEILAIPDTGHYIVYKMTSLERAKALLAYLQKAKLPHSEEISCK